MKYLSKLFIFFFLIVFNSMIAEDIDELKIVIELCLDNKSPDEGFVFSKSLLDKYENKETQLMIKELRTLCLVSPRLLKEAFENANDVIKTSSNPLYIGCAWFHKCDYALSQKEYNESLNNATIALKILEKIPDTEKEWVVCKRDYFKFVCHVDKRIIYKILGEVEKENDESAFIDAFIDSLRK